MVFAELCFQIGPRPFQQGPVAGIVAALELLSHALQRKPKFLFFPKPDRALPRQVWLSRRGLDARFFLLCLDRLTFPAACHSLIICRLRGSPAAGLQVLL